MGFAKQHPIRFLVLVWVVAESVSVFAYHWWHPHMTSMQVLQEFANWSIVLRWFQ